MLPKSDSYFPRVLLALSLVLQVAALAVDESSAQTRRQRQARSQASHPRHGMPPVDRDLVERGITAVCMERVRDPKGSVPIDDMQTRPSLPLGSPEAVEGAERAQRLLPLAKSLVVKSMNQLTERFGLSRKIRLQGAIARVQAVRRIRPDMESRDNASVYLRTPHTITFGTIFLASLPSDEAMLSVLSHELLHIADGDQDSLRLLFRAVGDRASNLTALTVHRQRAEELTCDLVGAMAARAFISQTPGYEPLTRRISRAVAHNCVTEDEGDEDHLSPRNTIRALLTIDPKLTKELVYGTEEDPD